MSHIKKYRLANKANKDNFTKSYNCMYVCILNVPVLSCGVSVNENTDGVYKVDCKDKTIPYDNG